jgi:archaeal type IV pilus assembly protein PilA
MMRPKILRSKKAISPILATLLLVVIAVSAVVMTYAWMNSYMDNATGDASVSIYKANVAFLDKGKTVSIDIGNSGTADTKIIGVYMGLDESNATKQVTSPTSLTLKADAIVSFKVSYTWVAGQTYYFRIVTEAGTEPLTFQEDAPQ